MSGSRPRHADLQADRKLILSEGSIFIRQPAPSLIGGAIFLIPKVILIDVKHNCSRFSTHALVKGAQKMKRISQNHESFSSRRKKNRFYSHAYVNITET